ncbi:MAG: hypothetical protein WAK01_06035 [Methylocystis sp.]
MRDDSIIFLTILIKPVKGFLQVGKDDFVEEEAVIRREAASHRAHVETKSGQDLSRVRPYLRIFEPRREDQVAMLGGDGDDDAAALAQQRLADRDERMHISARAEGDEEDFRAGNHGEPPVEA